VSDQPLVSIIIPTYNRAHLIGETLDSVLVQTYQNWECIVVDDGSTDATDDLMATYMAQESRFRYYHRPKDRLPGGNAARNYGIENSRGSYITFLDSDDYIAPFAIEDKLKYANGIFDCVITGHTRIKENLSASTKIIDEARECNYDEKIILTQPPVYMGDAFLSRSFVGEHRFDEDLLRGQDHVFFVELFRKKGNYRRIDGIHYLYNVTPSSITKKVAGGNKKYLKAQLIVGEKMINEYAHNHLIVDGYKRKSRNLYKQFIMRKQYGRIFSNFNHFRNAFNLSPLLFSYFLVINILTNRGFDRMKHKLYDINEK
tara:strand:+ start:17891 stop:18835 length:945 start_codon:yes stop_codon:yes gene_type:complete